MAPGEIDRSSSVLNHGALASPFRVSLTIIFVGKGKLAAWTDLSNAIKQAFHAAVKIVIVPTIADLRARHARDADIVLLMATRSCCNARTRLAIREACPLASTLYVTMDARKREVMCKSSGEIIHLAKDRPIPLDQIRTAVLDAMQMRICRLKLALSSAEPEIEVKPGLLEKLFLLTPQEARILASVRQGIPNKIVAKHLSITVRTVKAHLTEIFRKTGSTQRAELIVKCNELAASYAASLHAPSEVKLKDQIGVPFARRVTSRPSLPSPSVATVRSGVSTTFPSGARHQHLGERP